MKLTDIIQQPEGRKLEFKQEIPQKSDLAKTVVAFANDAGGAIYIGIRDKPREIIGVPEEKLLITEEQISNSIQDNCVPPIIPEITFMQSENYYIIKVLVHKGSTPPYYIKRKGINEGVYIRVGSISRQASPEMIAELTRKRHNISFDSELDFSKTYDQLNIESFRKAFFETSKQELTENVLHKLELIRNDQTTILPTNALILLSDDELKNRLFPFAIIECARFKGNDNSMFIDQKTITGNIITQSEEAYQFVLRHISQETTGYEGVYRIDKWEYPVLAIREAIRNAIIHRDYSLTGSDIKIAIYDDRIEITSPGKLLSSIDYNDMESGQSEIRNKTLAPVFKMLGIIEKWGNGLRLINSELQSYRNIGLRWTEPGVSFKVVFYKKTYTTNLAKHKLYSSPEIRTEVSDVESYLYGGYSQNQKKTKKSFPKEPKALNNSAKIIQLLRLNPKLSSAKIAGILGNITLDGVNYHLKKLSAKGKIKHNGPLKGGYWTIIG